MVGYVRNDITNEIADGEFITAVPLDGEFNAIEAAFNVSTGHSHDGTTGDGAPITLLGPGQELIIDANKIGVETHNTIDLGTNAARFKAAYFQGAVTAGSFVGDITGNVTGDITGNAGTATTLETARTIAISGQVTGAATSFDGSANISIAVATLSATNLNAGTVHSDRVSGSYTGITGTGALTVGSIASGFGNINIGSNTFTGNGSGLTSLNASNIATGTIAAARLPSHSADLLTSGTVTNARLPSAISVTTVTATGAITGELAHEIGGGYFRIGSYDVGDYGNGSARLWWNNDESELNIWGNASGTATVKATLFGGSGASLTDLSASQLSSGTVPSGRLSGSYTGITGTGALNTGSISSGFGNINIGSSTFTGNGSGLTSLNASELTSGTIPSARLGLGSSYSDWVRERYGDNTANEVGMMAFLMGPAGGHTAGTNYSSSSLRDPNLIINANNNNVSASFASAPSGTWKAMNTTSCAADERCVGVFLKVA